MNNQTIINELEDIIRMVKKDEIIKLELVNMLNNLANKYDKPTKFEEYRSNVISEIYKTWIKK